MGLAHAPGVMLVFTGLPITMGLPEGVSFIYLFVTMTWMLLAAVVAVREIQGEGWVKAIIPTAVGWLVGQFVLRIVIFEAADRPGGMTHEPRPRFRTRAGLRPVSTDARRCRRTGQRRRL